MYQSSLLYRPQNLFGKEHYKLLRDGIIEVKKICDMAYTYDVAIQIHVAGSPLATNVALHMEASIPNFTIHEHHVANRMDTSKGLTKYNLQPENGYFTIPELPGLGNQFLRLP